MGYLFLTPLVTLQETYPNKFKTKGNSNSNTNNELIQEYSDYTAKLTDDYLVCHVCVRLW